MEKMTLKETINEIADAIFSLEKAKEEYTDRVESALDTYQEGLGEDNGGKPERKNIIKFAKAKAGGKRRELEEEAANLAEIIDLAAA